MLPATKRVSWTLPTFAEVFEYCGDNLLPMASGGYVLSPSLLQNTECNGQEDAPMKFYQDTENRQMVTYFELTTARTANRG